MWYSQGTITATNKNAVINGVGTSFLQGVRVGDGITIAGSTSLHEVISVASNTQLTIKPAYTGTTGAGKQYAVAPVLGYDKDLSDAFNQLRLQFGDKLSSLQPWAHTATASAALDSLGFSASGKVVATGTPEQGRTALGLTTVYTAIASLQSLVETGDDALLQDLANPDKGAAMVGFTQNEETIATPQTIKERDSQTQLATDYISIKDAVEGAKRHNTSSLTIPLGTYQVTDTINLSGYHHLEGKGDASVLSLTPGIVGLDYVNRTGTFDDHPHRTLKNFRVRGDGQFTAPSSQEDLTGTTTGYRNTVHGSFSMQEGMTYEYNLVGCRINSGYTNMGLYNHYRSNGVGLLLHRVTSHTEQMLYARYNTEAAVKIESGQNIKLLGGAIEGNSSGVGLRVTNDFNNNQSIILDDLYMEVNGDLDKGIPSVQVDYHPYTRIKVVGGSYWRNIQNGITSGIYDWGRYVSFDSTSLGGGSYHFAERMSIGQGCHVSSMILARYTESSLAYGLEAREPTIMEEFKPGYLSSASNQSGLVFQTEVKGMSNTYKGQDNLITPGYPNGGGGGLSIPGSTERADLDYGDGSWTNFQFSDTGSYSSDYATLCTYAEPDASDHPWKLVTFLVRAESDCTIGFLAGGSSTEDSAISAALRLLGGKTYRITTIAYRTSAGVFRLRAFSMDGPASFSWLPHYFYIFKDMEPCISFANHVVSGAY